MKKRIFKKKKTQRFRNGIKFLSDYCELPRKIVEQEVSEGLKLVCEQYGDEDFSTDYHAYLDSVSIGLMWKYGTGWAGKESD